MSAQADFAGRLLGWHARHGRHDLPWQTPRTPYRVWVSEIMLQQTQVTTVIPYFERFMQRFPDLPALAKADEDAVLAHWSGLGYYARARNLHRCARTLVEDYGGDFPDTVEGWMALPGIGRSTAGAIVAQAFDRRAAVLDGNVRRWLARHAGVEGWSGEPRVLARLWDEAEARLPHDHHADYAQASMDLGASLCRARRPTCAICPVTDDCVARREDSTHRIPASRPRRVRPQRTAVMVLLQCPEGRWLLQRRPAKGIWGGLWTLPVLDDERAWDDWRQQWPDAQVEGEDLPAIHHAFTHFDLALTPRRLRTVRCDAPPQHRWTTLHAALDLGLPAPVRRFLETTATTVP